MNVPESLEMFWTSFRSECIGIGVVWCSLLPIEVKIQAANWVGLGARSAVPFGRAGNLVPYMEHWPLPEWQRGGGRGIVGMSRKCSRRETIQPVGVGINMNSKVSLTPFGGIAVLPE